VQLADSKREEFASKQRDFILKHTELYGLLFHTLLVMMLFNSHSLNNLGYYRCQFLII